MVFLNHRHIDVLISSEECGTERSVLYVGNPIDAPSKETFSIARMDSHTRLSIKQ